MKEAGHFTVNMRNFHSLSLRTNYTHMRFTPTFHPSHSREGNEFVEKVVIDIKTRILRYWHARQDSAVDTRTLNQSLCRRGFVDGRSWDRGKVPNFFSTATCCGKVFPSLTSAFVSSQKLNCHKTRTSDKKKQKLKSCRKRYQVFLKGTQGRGEREIQSDYVILSSINLIAIAGKFVQHSSQNHREPDHCRCH